MSETPLAYAGGFSLNCREEDSNMIWKCGAYSFDTQVPFVMGILNVTPDSFSDGGLHNTFERALCAARKMKEQGAVIIDVGGESTRPGAEEVSIEEELTRVLEVVSALAQEKICVSIDTRHVEVARACIEAGASIINDVSGFRDERMIELASSCDAGLVVMHMQGEPHTMQQNPTYDDVVTEVRDYLVRQANRLECAGVSPDRICIDPGPGFGKTPAQTVELVRNMHEFVRVGYPVMVAVSRKRYIGEMYDIPRASDRDQASAQEAKMACELGACVARVHNVEETIRALSDVRPYALLGLGANVALVAEEGEEREAKIAQINHVISELCMIPDTQVIDVSSYYASEPAYLEDQDEFVNAVVLIRTGIAPRDLLGYLHAIEDSLGRVRTIKNGPRTCDIDILDYQLYVSKDEELTLPHPLLMERDFVVSPLLEILPHHVLANGVVVNTDQVTVGKAVRIR